MVQTEEQKMTRIKNTVPLKWVISKKITYANTSETINSKFKKTMQ